MITLRKALASDKPRIAEISSQIWDGEDYVPDVLDYWLADPSGEVIVAIADGKLISFARRSYILPGYAWFEGIRTDPIYRNTGAAKAITNYFLEAMQRERADRIGLSTYIDNETSIHIIEKAGFQKVASYVYIEAARDAAIRQEGRPGNRVQQVPLEEAIEFILNSEFLHASHGHFPNGWKFYPFRHDPKLIISKMQAILGIKEEGRLIALLCVGKSLRYEEEFTIAFVDGRPAATTELLRHALHLAVQNRVVEIMVPRDETGQAPILPILQRMGFAAWNNFTPDVFVYERALQSTAQP